MTPSHPTPAWWSRSISRMTPTATAAGRKRSARRCCARRAGNEDSWRGNEARSSTFHISFRRLHSLRRFLGPADKLLEARRAAELVFLPVDPPVALRVGLVVGDG